MKEEEKKVQEVVTNPVTDTEIQEEELGKVNGGISMLRWVVCCEWR